MALRGVTAAKMHELGMRSGEELKPWSEAQLVQYFGKVGRFYYRIARAQDDRPVEANRVRKSIGAETSFPEDLDHLQLIKRKLEQIAQIVQRRLDSQQSKG